MGHGKESPRQKMIGMMYLVLTALLALNVSAEVLNAFLLIDNSLRTTTANSEKKNNAVYNEFNKSMEDNEAAVKPWKDKADGVKISSKELFDYIDTLKQLIVTTADGPEGRADSIQSKDNVNIPGQRMIKEKVDGKNRATHLKERIEAYKESLITIVGKDSTLYMPVISSIKNNLNTDDILGLENNMVPWQTANFDHLPLAGVITLMTKMQADVRNAEADILGYLFGKISASDYKFNKVEAIVNSPTNYVLKGQPYTAEVFIAASDSTVKPVIKLNGGSTLPVKEGKGMFTGNTGSAGVKSWGGVIELVNPETKEIKQYHFKSEYTVGVAQLVVSPTKMNVFYIGVDNPVDVSVPGIDPSKLQARISSGSIRRKGNSYVVKVKKVGKVRVSATADGKNMGSKEFRVKRVPDPIAKVGGKKRGTVSKNWLTAQSGVKADLENFDFALRYNVTSFTISATIKGYEEEARSNGARFTAQQRQLIKKIPSKRKVLISDIRAKGPDGTTRNLGAISFKLK
ncbi:MAG: gliding motility protein GldM [Bacteroidota bacterium]